MDHELECLDQYIEEARAKFDYRRKLRELNSQDNIAYPSELYLDKLDLSIKKNSAFVKRLKVFTESQKIQILDEIERLNLTKFISEVATSLIDAKLKLSDIPSVIEICTKLNRSYKDFHKQLLDQYSKYFPTVRRRFNDPYNALVQVPQSSSQSTIGLSGFPFTGSVSPTSNLVKTMSRNNSNNASVTSVNPSKMRVDLRLFAELIVTGVIPLKDGFPVLMNLLSYLMVYDKNTHQNANAILTFCKGCGDELMGLTSIRIQQLAHKYNKQLPTSDFISVKWQTSLKTYICDYYQSIQKHLCDLHEDLNQLIIKSNKICKSKGEVNKESRELIDIKRSELQKVQNIVNQLADLLGMEIYELPKCELVDETAKEENIKNLEFSLDAGVNSPSIKSSQMWDDEGTRSFYEDLLDLKSLFPNLIVKVSTLKKETESQSKDKLADPYDRGGDKDRKSTPEADLGQSKTAEKMNEDVDELDKALSSSSSEEENSNMGETSASQQSSLTMTQSVANRVQPDQYFAKLSNCVNRDMIDNAAIDFIRFYNTKFGRRKLVKTLFNVQRTRLDLLPFFSRLTATIYPYVPRVGNELVNHLRLDFRNLFKKKDQINIESKVKNVRFIGELVKFNLCPKHEALSCLKMLLSDFTHHHIEMTCNLLETCGRLLYKSPESHHQLRLILEQMMRKKMLLSVDSKYVTMIENAYYFTNPPEVTRHVVVEPPVHIYVRYLLCECLNRSTIEKVVKKIKMLNWSDKTLAKFVINCMIEAYNLKFYNIRYLAALLAALSKENQWISIAVIDGVVEDILLMMEINEIQFNQRRIPMIRYFGELYNYRLSDSSLVFKILYSLITYGIYYPEANQTLNQIPMSQLDPPDNLFRIKLVCDLLDTCGHYLSSCQEKKKLDCYLLFFQRYYWCKKHIYMLHPYCMAKSGNQFPASTEYLFNDAINNLRPSFQMASSYPEAIRSLQDFIDNLKND